MYNRQLLVCLGYLIFFTTACKVTKSTIKNTKTGLEEMIDDNPLFGENFSGIYIESLEDERVIYQQLADHRFIPASNVKIFTLYAALEILNKKIPSFQYLSQRDTLWIWGTGDPAFLYDKVTQDSSFISFVRSSKDNVILYSQANFMEDRFGAGWAWDDYPYSYQVEKSAFPIYGNRVTFLNSTGKNLAILPSYFSQYSIFEPALKSRKIIRAERDNQFSLATDLKTKKIKTSRPFTYQPGLITQLLTDTLKRLVQPDLSQRPLAKNSIVVERNLTDELYQRMMQESDNFIAEQLLLVTGGKLTDTLNTRQTIKHLEKNVFREVAKDIRWVDGSGLSRYNLFTPRSIAWVLKKLPQKINQNRLLDLFPAGGLSGSLKEWYGGKDQPYVFAKTGSMSGVYCLSGYLKTKKGELLLISFMHNNFQGSSKKYKKAMTPILEWLYEN